MGLWDRLRGKSRSGAGAAQPASRDEEEWFRLASQQTMHLLHSTYGIESVFREDITSPAQADALGDDAPLTYVWVNEEGGEAALVCSLNRWKVHSTMLTFMDRNDPLFEDVFHRICGDVSTVTQSALLSTMEQTGASPKEICDAARAEWERQFSEKR